MLRPAGWLIFSLDLLVTISSHSTYRLLSLPSVFSLHMAGPAVRFVAAKAAVAKNSPGVVQLMCQVKPGVSAQRKGIAAVSDERVEICVSAQPREGEANRAVRDVIADALKIAKSDVEVVKGLKGREKTVAVRTNSQGTPDEQVERIKAALVHQLTRAT